MDDCRGVGGGRGGRDSKRSQLGVSERHRPRELVRPVVPTARRSPSLSFFKQINASGKAYSRKQIDLIFSELFFTGFLGVHFLAKHCLDEKCHF